MKIDGLLIFYMLLTVVLNGIIYWKDYDYKNKAIEHNCAMYHPTTGDFEWRNLEQTTQSK